jgi:hypothetical protein
MNLAEDLEGSKKTWYTRGTRQLIALEGGGPSRWALVVRGLAVAKGRRLEFLGRGAAGC